MTALLNTDSSDANLVSLFYFFLPWAMEIFVGMQSFSGEASFRVRYGARE